MNKTREIKGIKIVLVSILALALLLSCIVIISGTGQVAQAIKSENMESQSTDLGEMLIKDYDKDTTGKGKVFDGEVFWELVSKVSEGTITSKAQMDSWTPATKTSADFRAKNGAKDIVVTIGGKQWIAMCLSCSEKTVDGKTVREPILTFWLANSSTRSSWGYNVNTTDRNYNDSWQNEYTSNLYGTSYIRTEVLNNGGFQAMRNMEQSPSASSKTVTPSATNEWAIYTMDTVNETTSDGKTLNKSIKEFIEVPNNVSWQLDQQALNYLTSNAYRKNYGFNNNNDALNAGGNGSTGDYLTELEKNGLESYYKAWGNDTLWLPSVTETGVSGEEGIWKASDNTRANTGSTTSANGTSWLRSAHHDYYCGSYRLTTDGSVVSSELVHGARSVRPAFHLNLSKVAGSLGFEQPQDVTNPYNGQSQSLADITDTNKTNWFNSTKIKLDNLDGEIKDVGTYRIKATIITDDEEDVFEGDFDTSKGETNNRERVFTFTITKKKIGVVVGKDSNEMPVVTLSNSNDIYAGDTLANGRAPNLGFSYSGGSLSGPTTELPTAVGTYSATAVILNTDTCKNYELISSTSNTITFTIEKTDVTPPAISGQYEVEYTGDDIYFYITSGDKDKINIDLPSGMSWKNNDRSTNTLIAKKAGKYQVVATLVDDTTTQWPDGETDAIYLDYEITKKPLSVTITCSASGFEWQVGATPTVTITEDSHINDTTDLYIYYIDSKNPNVKHDGINANKVTNGNTRIITMPSNIPQGSYTIGVELYGSNNDNDNYSLDTPKTAMFTVKGSKVTVDVTKIIWQYNSTIVTDVNNVKLVYTGNMYQFSVDSSVLQSNGAKVDITQGVNGYGGDVNATNAKSAYSVTVYVTNYDNTFESYSAQYTLNYSIDKAKYNLSGLHWPSKNTTEYSGSAQGMTLSGAPPQGLTVTYIGNGNVPVNSYNTTAKFLVSEPENYYVPTKGAIDTYEGSFEFDFAWSIIPQTLDVSWKDDNTGGSQVYKLPILKSIGSLDVDSMVDYTYYDTQTNQEVTSLPSNVTSEQRYKAIATLKPAFATNYTFKGTTNEYSFVIGANKYIVKLTLIWDGMDIDGAQIKYSGSPISPTIVIIKTDSGTVTPSNITLKYYKDSSSSPITGEPTAVGHYRVETELNYGSDLNYIDNDSAVFEFDIVKEDFDVSGLRWEYTHTDIEGNVVSATYDFAQSKWIDATGREIHPMTYDKTAHTLTLVGKDSIVGLAVTVSGEEHTDAGSNYTAQVNFEYDTDNYNEPAFPTSLAWSIDKAKIDATHIVWGYSIGVSQLEEAYIEKLPYTRMVGGEIKYTVKLINVPDDLKEFIKYKYTGTADGSATAVGSYATEYYLDNFDSVNYESVVMPSGLPKKFNWEIDAKRLAKPVFDNTWSSFDSEVHDFVEMFGITEPDWNLYINVAITKDGVNYAGLSGENYNDLTDRQFKAINAGEYIVRFELILPNSSSGAENIKWLEWPDFEYNIQIKKYEIEVKEWQGSNTNAEVDLADWVKPFVEYKYKDSNGNEVTIANMQPGVAYVKELCVKKGYESDISVFGKNTLSVIRPGSGPIKATKPTFDADKKVIYDGNTHTVEEFLKKAADKGVKFDVAEMIDAGDYVVTISLDGDTYVWEDGGNDSYTYTVNIAKATISQNTLVWATGADGLPMLTVRGHSDIEFKYTYLDADGLELTLSSIADGMKYAKVVARINSNNYDIIDANKVVVEELTYDPSSQDDKVPSNTGNGNVVDFGKAGEILKEWWQVIASVISIVLIIVFISKGLGYRGKRKKAQKATEKYSNYYATGLFGLAMSAWTAIACVLMGLAVLSFVYMMIQRHLNNKAQEELDEAKDEFNAQRAEIENKQRNDQMQMMLMGMFGNNQSNVGNQYDRVLEREVAAANANDEIIKELVEGQKMIMDMLARLSELQNNQPQIVERVVEKEVPIEMIVEKVVEVPIEKIIEKPSTKEASAEVEKNVEVKSPVDKKVKKEVKVQVEVPEKPKKEVAPRLTLDEAYALLSKQQKKYFDDLKAYALSKDKCKEKKSTYFTVFGHNTANPLLKLTIKKDTVVALYKMEDEYMKDIRRNATSDGAKIKVKETELVVADAQSFKTAKEMIDLREDQIERYEDFLKEQKAMKKR